jgi:erythrocyte band 7 integral membrane protein
MPEKDYHGRRGKARAEQVLTKQPRSSAAPPGYDVNESGQSATDSFMDSAVVCLAALIAVATFPISIPVGINVVTEYERAVIYRNGRVKGKKAAGPGLFWVLPCTDTVHKVDMRELSFDIPPQQILTKDSVSVGVDAVIYYKIFDAQASVNNVQNAFMSTRLLAMTTLRNILGTRSLAGILNDREQISKELLHILDAATDPWGISVGRVELKDVTLPREMQRAMAAEAEADREAKAKIIAAEGEVRASKNLKEAADTIASSGAALQLRYLQTLTTVAAEKNSTILFPIPIEMLQHMSKK